MRPCIAWTALVKGMQHHFELRTLRLQTARDAAVNRTGCCCAWHGLRLCTARTAFENRVRYLRPPCAPFTPLGHAVKKHIVRGSPP